MATSQKKCPMCAEEIPLAATTCEYCSAQFKVTSTGYCQNCHQVREADGNGQCKVCGNEVLDLRVESKFIEEPMQASPPVSQPIARTKLSTTRKKRLPFGILAGILILAIISAFLWFGRNSIPSASNLFVTTTPTVTTTVTTTFTPINTPTATSMRTPPPTRTATPIPAWVAEFAEPILAAITNVPPHFEDDFSQASDGWQADDRCRVKIQDGFFTMSVEAGRWMARCSNPGLRVNNFVLRVDTDFSELGSRDSAQIGWNGITPYHGDLTLSLLKEGNWSIDVCGNNSCTNFDSGWQLISPTQKVVITIISKDRKYAIYMDEIPVSYVDDIKRPPGTVITLGMDVPSLSASPMIKYDNLKIWNLDYIDSTSTTMPATTYTPPVTSPATLDQRVLNPANQHLYLYVKQGMGWHEARDHCILLGGHLVTIQVPSENKFVYDLATDNVQAGTWLGATDEEKEGIWVWVTGEPTNYWKWGDYWNYLGDSGTDDYLAFSNNDKTWYDQPDGNKFFVCEWESTSP